MPRGRHRFALALPLILSLALSLVAAVAPQAGHAAGPAQPADPTVDVLACEAIDFAACPALLKVAAARKPALATLATALRDPGATSAQRVKAAQALAVLDARDHLDAFESAAAALATDPVLIDVRAAQARLGDARAAAPLRVLLASGDLRAKVLAAGSLGLLRDKAAVSTLTALLSDDLAPRLQAAAAHALGLIGDATATDALLAMAGRPKLYPPARAQALAALMALDAAGAVVLAAQLVDHPSRDVGRAALQVLAAAPTQWTEPAVLFALDTPGLRGEAAKVLTSMRLKAAGPLVLATAVRDDVTATERLWLLAALAELKPQGAGAVLVKRLKVAPPAEQVQILRALPDLGDRTVVPDLVPLLRSPDTTVVSNVVYALENLTGKNIGADEKAWRVHAGLDAPPPAADAGSQRR